MPITVPCSCQNSYRVKDELAGKTIKCPHCQQPVVVPMFDEPALAASDPYGGGDLQSSLPASLATDPYQQQTDPYQQLDEEYKMQGGDPPQMPSPYASPEAHVGYGPDSQSHSQPSSGGVNGGQIVAGLAMMGGAVLWFVVGMAAGRIFFYPPILFIFGLVSFVKGLMSSE